jgi:hypothetical protein
MVYMKLCEHRLMCNPMLNYVRLIHDLIEAIMRHVYFNVMYFHMANANM